MNRRPRSANTPEKLRKLQMDFAGHIRDPDRRPAPADVENRRMKIYRELFFNNINSLLSNNFPVLRRLYGDDAWRDLVRDFYSRHHSRTPLFPELPKEFLRYLQDERGQHADDPAFLHELAHYEWVELALSLDERELRDCAADPDGDLLEGVPVISPLAWPLVYRYPVHRIRPDNRPTEPPADATRLLVYRNRADEVKFMQLNESSHLLLTLLKENRDRSGRSVLAEVAERTGQQDAEAVLAGGAQLLEELKNRDVVLGTRPVSAAEE